MRVSQGGREQRPGVASKPNTKPESTETGSSLLFPLFGTWTTAYQKQFVNSSNDPIVTITTGSTGSGIGISDAATGTVNIGASDAYLSSADTSQYPGLLNIALAISAQQVNYNLPGIKNLNLNGTVLARSTRARSPPGTTRRSRSSTRASRCRAMKIVTLHRADSSGDTFLFTSYLSDQDPSVWSQSNVNTTVSWPSVPGALAETGNSGMVAGCQANKGCIAYIGISYLQKTQAAGLGDGVSCEQGRQVPAADPGDDQRRGQLLHREDPGQRDDLDDRRPGGERLPDRQLRVRDREDQASPTRPGRGHQGASCTGSCTPARTRPPTWTRWTSSRFRPAWSPSPTR